MQCKRAPTQTPKDGLLKETRRVARSKCKRSRREICRMGLRGKKSFQNMAKKKMLEVGKASP